MCIRDRSNTGPQSQCTRCHTRSAVGEVSAGATMSAASASANVRTPPPSLPRSRCDTSSHSGNSGAWEDRSKNDSLMMTRIGRRSKDRKRASSSAPSETKPQMLQCQN
eukprot:8960664-Alexandrium_andersonii.AAC.1